MPRVRDSKQLKVHATGPPAAGTVPAPPLGAAVPSAAPPQASPQASDPTLELASVSEAASASQAVADRVVQAAVATDGAIASGSRELLEGLSKLAGYDLAPDDGGPAATVAAGERPAQVSVGLANAANSAGKPVRARQVLSASTAQVSTSSVDAPQAATTFACRADGRPRGSVLIEEIETVLGGSALPSGPSACEQMSGGEACSAAQADVPLPEQGLEVLARQGGSETPESWGMEELD